MGTIRAYGRLWLCCLILLAVTVQGLVPLGFMPTIGKGDGKVEIVICTGKGPATVLMDALAVPGANSHDADGDTPPCPFAPVMADGTAYVPPPPFPVTAGDLMPPPRLSAPPVHITVKNWFAQGPPRA